MRKDRGTRFLRRARDGGGRSGLGCDHWWVTRSAGASESARNLWLQVRLAANWQPVDGRRYRRTP